MEENNSIILENKLFKLELSTLGKAKSLLLKSKGTECLFDSASPIFTLSEERLYNNEQKLAHPTGSVTFSANSISLAEDVLTVGFETINVKAKIKVSVADKYIAFSLLELMAEPGAFGVGTLDILPPVQRFRLINLNLKKRDKFGEWLNVLSDSEVAVNVISASPYAKVGSCDTGSARVMFGEVLSDVRLRDVSVALIVSEPDDLLDAINSLEEDMDLPRGAKSRRSGAMRLPYYWAANITPKNVSEHIEYARKGGFSQILIYYKAIFNEDELFTSLGNYDTLRPEYKNGIASLCEMLNKIKEAGITPGLHVLHSHIGMKSGYLSPVADHRLNLKRQFTLARECRKDDTDIYVEEYPEGVPVHEKMRVLKFMGELIRYDSVTKERPYRFIGCERGYNGTVSKDHEAGTIGGILDISEYCANSAYIDQKTSLQDEIADKIATVYNAGFEFIYFDGSEGVSPPFDVNVGLAQWRVYSKLKKEPLFSEGAARSNFSWHMLSGGNAFDVWESDTFKEMVRIHVLPEARRMKNDLTRVNFGWWAMTPGQRADIIEYGAALAASQGCPASFNADLELLKSTPRTDDILEVLRRWEDARKSDFITESIKKELENADVEHTLLINENREYEITAWEEIKEAANGDSAVTAFIFARRGRTYAAFWCNTGDAKLLLPLSRDAVYLDELFGEAIEAERRGEELILPIGKRRYLITDVGKDKLKAAFLNAHRL